MRKLPFSAIAIGAVVASLLVSPVSPANASAGGRIMDAPNHPPTLATKACSDGIDPVGLPGPVTKRSEPLPAGGLLELRYSTNACAWGRISGVFPYADVWVDRAVSLAAANAGQWTGPLGYSLVNPGETSGYSLAYNDNGPVMRACTHHPHAGFVCTGWY